MPRSLQISADQYYLKLNDDPFSGQVSLDIVDRDGKRIQNFLTVTSISLTIQDVPWAIGEKLGLFTSLRIVHNGKLMTPQPEEALQAKPDPTVEELHVLKPVSEAA